MRASLSGKISLSTLIAILFMVTLALVSTIVVGCQSSQISTAPPPPPPPVQTTQTTPAQNSQWSWVPSQGNIVNGGQYAYFPANGAFVQAGHTLVLSWSADNSMDTFIFTSNQFSNFNHSLSYASGWMANGSGASGNIRVTVQNSDTYYAVVRNTSSFGGSIKLYRSTLTEQ